MLIQCEQVEFREFNPAAKRLVFHNELTPEKLGGLSKPLTLSGIQIGIIRRFSG
jgi:hypothetical protein